MSQHKSSISWTRTTVDFDYDTFVRDHAWTLGAGIRVEASSAPEFRGNPQLTNPEEALVAALASCHMLTFLAVCAKRGIVVDAYEDRAEGILDKNAEGRLCITRVTLRPKITFAAGTDVDSEKLAGLHASAHRGCFIANSVKTEVMVEPG